MYIIFYESLHLNKIMILLFDVLFNPHKIDYLKKTFLYNQHKNIYYFFNLNSLHGIFYHLAESLKSDLDI